MAVATKLIEAFDGWPELDGDLGRYDPDLCGHSAAQRERSLRDSSQETGTAERLHKAHELGLCAACLWTDAINQAFAEIAADRALTAASASSSRPQ